MEFTFPMTDEARKHVDAVRAEMVRIFDMEDAEAIGRINRHWGSHEFLEQNDVDTLTHDIPEFWAKWIVYGTQDFWVNEGELTPVPYPT